MMRKTFKNQLFLIFLIFSFCSINFSQIGKEVKAASFDISANAGDIIIYKSQYTNETNYQKYYINSTEENNTSFKVNYDIFNAETLSTFNDTADNSTSSVITGNLSEDLFSEFTMLSILLSIGTNFTSSKGELQAIFDEMEEMDDRINIRFETRINGFSFKMTFYFRIVLLIKVMTMEVFYSSTGLLLKSKFWARDPTSSKNVEINIDIIPELSTVPGADENPFNPLDIKKEEIKNSTTTNSIQNTTTTNSIQKISWNLKIILYSGFAGILISLIFLIKKRNIS